jgi:hypothetical protein
MCAAAAAMALVLLCAQLELERVEGLRLEGKGTEPRRTGIRMICRARERRAGIYWRTGSLGWAMVPCSGCPVGQESDEADSAPPRPRRGRE